MKDKSFTVHSEAECRLGNESRYGKRFYLHTKRGRTRGIQGAHKNFSRIREYMRQFYVYGFKHHYMLHALDSEVLCALLTAICAQRAVTLSVLSPCNHSGAEREHTVCPLKIFASTQSGREYLLCYHYIFRRPMFFRLNTIRAVKPGAVEKHYARYEGYGVKLRENLWGTSMNQDFSLDHIEMDVSGAPDEDFIVDGLYRERRCGSVERVAEGVWRFSADVYDASEMLPWVRTFTGRILALRCRASM